MLSFRPVGLIAIFLAVLASHVTADTPPEQPTKDGLVLWLDASVPDSVNADAQGKVSKWTDKSGHPYAFAGTGGSAPQLVQGAINKRPAIQFSGKEALVSTDLIRPKRGAMSVFIVARSTPFDHAQNVASTFILSDGTQPLLSTAGTAPDNEDPGSLLNLTTTALKGDKPVETTIYYFESFTAYLGPFQLGKGPGPNGTFFDGDIAEVLVYDRPFLSAGERQPVEQYLHAKWNAKVPLAPGEWTRDGDLGTTPQHVHQDLPLSDQENAGKWTLDPKFSDDFKEPTLDLSRWHLAPTAKGDWHGRPPALFMPSNVAIKDGMLEVTDRKGDVPEMAKYPGEGFAGYTTALVKTIARTGYGYYEVKARPMSSAFCSAFWLSETGDENNSTEIDIFEMGAKARGFEHEDHMTAHVWSTPQEKRHWAVGSTWKSPWLLRDDFHVYGFEWNKDELRWYVDGVLVHKLKNTNWFYPMAVIFDSEPMWKWFGKCDDADLPSTFSVQYLRVWRQTP